MAWSWTSLLSADATAPGAARTFVETSMARVSVDPAVIGETCEDLVVIVSELVTNAVQARARQVRVDLDVEGSGVRLAVTDHGLGMPTVSGPAAADQPYGRGLAIVAALSQDWGVVPLAVADGFDRAGQGPDGPGKTVWVRLVLPRVPDAG